MMPPKIRIALAAAVITLAAAGSASAGFFGAGGLFWFCGSGGDFCAVP